MKYVNRVKNIKNNQICCLSAAFLFLLCSGCTGVRDARFQSAPGADGSDLAEMYRLHAGDQVDVQIYREPQISGTFQIDASGLIRHPLCGSFTVAGLTLDEAEARLTDVLAEKYLVNPTVILSIVSSQSSHVVLLGEVANPGVHPLLFGESITLLQAVAEAGGFTDLASVNRVTVTRTVNGKETSVRVRISKMISGQEPDMLLLPNDVIVVPQVVF